MSFTQLPPELLLEIASSIERERDLSSFVQINRAMYQIMISQLYRHNAKESNGSAIQYTVDSDNCSTLQRTFRIWTGITDYTDLAEMFHFLNSSFLYSTVVRNNLATVKMLLDYGIDPNSRNRFEHTFLDDASGQKCIAIVKSLLTYSKIQVNICNHIRIPALYYTVRGDYTESVCKIDGIIFLRSAIRDQKPEIARLLVNRKEVDPNALSSQSTPLWLAVHVKDRTWLKFC